jgi:hypothetical protein
MSVQEIASCVSSTPFNSKTPPGKAQQIILEALQITADSFGHANAIFYKIGITVLATRQGRHSVPVVRINREIGAARNEGGDFDEWDYSNANGLDLSAISEWMADESN